MQTTKQQILTLLKRTGSITIEEAAGALSIASMTARQHLVGLERDGLVRSEKVRRTTGRPHFLFTLTPKGDDLFPRRYDLLAQIILDEVCQLQPAELEGISAAEKRSLLIQRTADRLVERYRFQVEGRPLETRVAAVTEVLQTIGGFAEWCPSEEGYEIRDYNCVFARLVPEQGSDCEWHVRLITQLLRWPVRHELLVNGRVNCCRYMIASEAPTQEEGLFANA